VIDKQSESRTAYLRTLKPGCHVHISGICGTGTSAVLSLLKQLGLKVTGSDKAFYPPMGEYVKNLADKVYQGYSEQNLEPRPDLVVIGNSLSRGNVEVEFVLEQGIPYASMPEVFQAFLIGSRDECPTSVVVIGTHGKTTTTALIVSMLVSAGISPGYFVGGIPVGFSSNIRIVDKSKDVKNRIVVLEGDEYDSAFFAKCPKFHFYRPDILVITSLEFDHADIYESVEQIEAEFIDISCKVPKSGTILVCDQGERLKKFAKALSVNPKVLAKVKCYGQEKESDFSILSRAIIKKQDTPIQEVMAKIEGEEYTLSSILLGMHGALNMLAAASVGSTLSHLLTKANIQAGISQFKGVLRRQEIVGDINGVLVMEDFAHHPSAVATTISGLKESYPDKRIMAVFEPRSNTSRRSFFQKEYVKSFRDAQIVYILEVLDASGYQKTSSKVIPLDVPGLVKEIRRHENVQVAKSFKNVQDLKQELLANVRQGDLVVIMSNGDFGGLVGEVIDELGKR
jgi:UDP-N-acetylmuramate: L-alanyl-gamma-D-glutamyl-meso-diaminopimelate ligase